MQPKFSVIIPTYNRAELVFRTLESALAQRYPHFEVLVVDDGSTDSTQERFARYSHPKVSYFRKENGERGAARNFGANRAVGDYLTFFDSDDLLTPEHLDEAARCVDAFRRPEVFSLGFRIEDTSGAVRSVVKDLPDPLNDFLLEGNVLGCNPVFVRKDVFAQNPFCEERGLAGTEDWLLWLRLASRYPFRFWNRVTCRMIDHDGRSVRNFKEDSLNSRSRILLEQLRADPVFVERYGRHLRSIQAYRDIYTGLHLALSGGTLKPIWYLGRAGFRSPASLLRRSTLGTLKHVVRNAVRPRA